MPDRKRKNYIAHSGEERLIIQSAAVFDFLRKGPEPETAKELVILLHGFNETGRKIFDALSEPVSATLKDALIIAPNGPFPIPRRSESGTYKVGNAWYLYDPGTQEYFIDMRVALEFLRAGLTEIGALHLPKRVIGFSQGGYLAPFAGHFLGGTKQVIGIGCEYLCDELPEGIEFVIDGVHGATDDVIPLSDAQKTHEQLKERGVCGSLKTVGAGSHKIDKATAQAVCELLAAPLPLT